jgi:hypothetical protein
MDFFLGVVLESFIGSGLVICNQPLVKSILTTAELYHFIVKMAKESNSNLVFEGD